MSGIEYANLTGESHPLIRILRASAALDGMAGNP